jgi:predicted RNase H-like HicB family nuclease
VPDLPGCITTGTTLEETEINIREAIAGHLETLREFGERVPLPASIAKEIEIPPAA